MTLNDAIVGLVFIGIGYIIYQKTKYNKDTLGNLKDNMNNIVGEKDTDFRRK